MKFTDLQLRNCPLLRDLQPLKHLPLTSLTLSNCPQVRDLEPLKGMPLKTLTIDLTGVTDLKPLQAMRLEDISLTPNNITQGMDILRGMKSLQTIGIGAGQPLPSAEFWARYDDGEFKK